MILTRILVVSVALAASCSPWEQSPHPLRSFRLRCGSLATECRGTGFDGIRNLLPVTWKFGVDPNEVRGHCEDWTMPWNAPYSTHVFPADLVGYEPVRIVADKPFSLRGWTTTNAVHMTLVYCDDGAVHEDVWTVTAECDCHWGSNGDGELQGRD